MNRAAFLKSIQSKKYRELLPDFQEKKTQAFTTLLLSLVALSFFGFFAINPTVSKITELHKQLEDAEFADQRLTEKINNLGILFQKYNELSADLPIVFNAIPAQPDAGLLLGQIQAISKKTNVTLLRVQSFQVELSRDEEGVSKHSSFSFSVDVDGLYDELFSFTALLANFDRIVSFDAISISTSDTHEDKLTLNIRGKAYFKK